VGFKRPARGDIERKPSSNLLSQGQSEERTIGIGQSGPESDGNDRSMDIQRCVESPEKTSVLFAEISLHFDPLRGASAISICMTRLHSV
jgi:hypothetical protein